MLTLPHRPSVLITLCLLSSAACRQRLPDDVAEALTFRPDSIALEQRSSPLSHEPSYHVTITREGLVHYRSADSSRAVPPARIDTADYRRLISVVSDAWPTALPDTIASNRTFCPYLATDQATRIVTLFHAHDSKRIVDYQGCFWAPAALRTSEFWILRTAGLRQLLPTTP
jgi:hypothetical protein